MIVLAISIVTFALGAAALLRSTHGEFVSLQTSRTPREPVLMERWEAVLPTVAILRVETATGSPPAADKLETDTAPPNGAPQAEQPAELTAAAEPKAETSPAPLMTVAAAPEPVAQAEPPAAGDLAETAASAPATSNPKSVAASVLPASENFVAADAPSAPPDMIAPAAPIALSETATPVEVTGSIPPGMNRLPEAKKEEIEPAPKFRRSRAKARRHLASQKRAQAASRQADQSTAPLFPLLNF
jgi:hypothetical protein